MDGVDTTDTLKLTSGTATEEIPGSFLQLFADAESLRVFSVALLQIVIHKLVDFVRNVTLSWSTQQLRQTTEPLFAKTMNRRRQPRIQLIS